MKKIYLLIVLVFTVFFIGCKGFEPELCHITVNFKDIHNCTYYIEKTEVPMFSYFKVKIIPDWGYYINDLTTDYYWNKDKKIYNSTDEENTYYFLANDKNQEIWIDIDQYDTYDIEKDAKVKNLRITTSVPKTFAGDTVTFTIIPDECFYLDPATVEVRKKLDYYYSYKYEILSFTQSQTNPNEFSFIMPDRDVAIYAEAKFAIEVSPRKKNIKQGEPVIFDIINHKPENTFDIELSDCYSTSGKASYKSIEKGIELADTYALPDSFISQNYPETETGLYTLHIYPKNSNYNTKIQASTEFVVDLADKKEDWTTIGIKTWNRAYFSKSDRLSILKFLLSNTDIPDSINLTLKYSLENTVTSETDEGTLLAKYYTDDDYCFFSLSDTKKDRDQLAPFNKMVIWIEDEDLKYISRKVPITLYN